MHRAQPPRPNRRTYSANVTFSLRRSRGRGRYTASRRLMSMDAAAGANAVTLTARRLGRRAGLYRLTAGVADGVARAVQYRIRRTAR